MFKPTRAVSSLSRGFLRTRLPYSEKDGPLRVKRVKFLREPFVSKRRIYTLFRWSIAATIYFSLVSYYDTDPAEEEEEQSQVMPDKQLGFERDAAKTHEERALREVKELANLKASIEEKIASMGEKSKEKKEVPTKTSEMDSGEALQEGEESTQGEEVTAEDDEDIVPDEQPEDAWFVPLTLARKCDPVYYRSDDPEWISFTQLAKNKEENQMVRRQLAGLIGEILQSAKPFQNMIGAPMRVGRYWLDIDYPDSPPPEYERGGIEITDDYVAYVVRPVRQVNVNRLNRVLWPEPMAFSFWSTCNTLWSLQMAKVKGFFNIKPDAKSDFSQFGNATGLPMSLPMIKQGPKDSSSPEKSGIPIPPSPDQRAGASVLPGGLDSSKDWVQPLPKGDMTSAVESFKRALMARWKPPPPPPPRGTVLLSGLVELSGPRALCVLEVRGYYHPIDKKWATIGVAVRRVQPRLQRAKG